MTGEYLTAPGLLSHVFLAAGGQDPQAGWERLRAVWHDVTRQFGLGSPIPLLAVPADLPPEPAVPADGRGLLAAAERSGASIWQASAWADHGLLCLTVMMSPARDTDCGRAWADLEDAWSHAMAGLRPGTALGEARIFLALLARQAGNGLAHDHAANGPALDLVRVAAPEPSSGPWWQHWDTVPLDPRASSPDEALVWEIGSEVPQARIMRRLAVVAPAASERQADHILWTRGDGGPAPLTRHLMHAARLRYQVRVFDDGRPSRYLRDQLGLLIDDLSAVAVNGHLPAQDPADHDWLPVRLGRLHLEAARLRERLAAMRDAVGIVGENMRRALKLPAADAAVGPLSDDRALAAWFGQQVDDEIGRLDGAVELARSARNFLNGEGTAPASPRAPAEALRLGSPKPRRRARSPARWVVILTALPVEYEAIKEYLGGPVSKPRNLDTAYELGRLPAVRGAWRVAIAQTGQGSVSAALHLQRAISHFAPEIALFVGVAGGRKDVRQGDVVVADAIYDYEAGKSVSEGYLPRMRTHLPAHRMVQEAWRVAREKRWQQRIRPVCPQPPPAAFVKPVVTGGKVVAHDRSEVALLIDQNASDALAVEMEGYGFLEAAHLSPEVGALVIRGISDLLTDKGKDADEHWQPIAVRHAAAFAIELLDSIGASPPHQAVG